MLESTDGSDLDRPTPGDRDYDGGIDGVPTRPDEGIPQYGTREIADILLQRQRRFLVTEVYMCQGEFDISRFLSHLSCPIKATSIPRAQRTEQFHIVTRHTKPGWDHFHAVHLCSWNCSSCRCGRLENRKEHDLIFRKAIPIKRLCVADLKIIIQYIVGGSKELIYFKIAGKRGRLRDEDRGLPEVGGEQLASAGMVEVCSSPEQVLVQGDGPYSSLGARVPKGSRVNVDRSEDRFNSGDGASSSDDEEAGPLLPHIWRKLNDDLKNPTFRPEINDIKTFMMRYFFTYMHGITCSSDWIRYGMDRVNANGMLFNAGLKRYQAVINNSDLSQLLEIQTGSCSRPTYSAGSYKRVKIEYWSCEESIEMLLVLLKEQFHTLDKVIDFLYTNYEVLEKKTGKKNCICIIGGASAGKSFWADGLCDFCLNPGEIKNPSKRQKFPFKASHNRRVIEWECRYDRHFDKDVLNLLQGKSFLADIKLKHPQPVNRTPVFVLANYYPFTHEQSFVNRIYKYEWNRCELLYKYREKQPLPLAHGLLVLFSADRLASYSNDRIENIIKRVWNK